MKKAVKQNPKARSTSREDMFLMAAAVRALRVPVSEIPAKERKASQV
ncbi:MULTISPECIES: hypothetical protein [Enterobacteriaceae]|nr:MULTISPECIES: hypothetical protein [Enterobacteriaceae]HDR2614485.1 hypothetical protein [Enterobacter ludwigii]KLV69591.1 hypothetical protein SK37_05070 [Citrobacter sp. MGH109]MDT7093040.1 hypothetical protein [Citrobacter freundii]QMT08981.1 hypothetical protein H1R18_26355 [Enterobacter kobei]CAI9394805.1 hypothetical protein CITSP_04648 [Citrobacter sp. T1.2D-1]